MNFHSDRLMSTSSFSGAYNILTTFVLDLSSSEVTVIYTSTYNPFANSAPGRLYSIPVKRFNPFPGNKSVKHRFEFLSSLSLILNNYSLLNFGLIFQRLPLGLTQPALIAATLISWVHRVVSIPTFAPQSLLHDRSLASFLAHASY